MSAPVEGFEYTVTGSAVAFSTILSLTGPKRFLSHLVVRAGSANAGNVYLGGSGVTTGANRWVYLEPKDSFAIGLESKWFNTENLFVVGTPGDLLHIIDLA
jgi:hypothetical protein